VYKRMNTRYWCCLHGCSCSRSWCRSCWPVWRVRSVYRATTCLCWHSVETDHSEHQLPSSCWQCWQWRTWPSCCPSSSSSCYLPTAPTTRCDLPAPLPCNKPFREYQSPLLQSLLALLVAAIIHCSSLVC